MQIIKFFVILLAVLVSGLTAAVAQSKVVVVPLGDDLLSISLPPEPEPEPEPSPYLEDAFGADKVMVFNKGWDTRLNNKTIIDPTVNISLKRLEPVFGYPGIIFTGREIRHWGEQRYFPTVLRIYAKAVLLVDKGDTVEGGPFEWSLNKQGFISFHNILRTDSDAGWVRAWTNPRRGDKVWFFLLSDDEKYSSNPISFIWP